MSRIITIASMVLVLGATSQASAYECISSTCPAWCMAVPYSITQTSPDIGEEASVAETRRGMEDWTLRSCTNLTASYGGRSGGNAGSGDGQSLIGWVEGGWRFGSSAIGVTSPRWSGECIVEADMVMNGENFTWTTAAGSGSNVNTYSIALHEGGHYYGLDHSSDPGAAMYFAYTGGIDAIGSDDENGICFLYPGSGGGPVDCTTTGCASGQECVAGVCQGVMGDGTVCSPCENSSACGGANDLCLGYPDGLFCGRACTSPAQCTGDGEVCAQLAPGVTQCIRVVSERPTCAGSGGPVVPTPECTIDTQCEPTELCQAEMCVPRPTDPTLAELGQPCADSAACNSSLCGISIGQVCTQRCDGFDSSSCPSGFFCDGEATGTCGDGLCVAGGPGPVALGGDCSEDRDCATTMCDTGKCASPCQPGGATVCADGFECQVVQGLVGCGACRTAGTLSELGGACETGDDCQSGECARRSDETFCTSICDETSLCPDNFDCVSAGDVSLCIGAPTERIDSGCGCRLVGETNRTGTAMGLFGLFGLLVWRRRR